MRLKHLYMALGIFALVLGAMAVHENTASYAGLTGAQRVQLNGGNVVVAQTHRRQFNEERGRLGLDRIEIAAAD